MADTAINLTKEKLVSLHQEVPADHYDRVIKHNLPSRIWHGSRFYQVMQVVKAVDGPVLDIGCHGGTFTKRLLGGIGSQEIFGVDISPKAIALAAKRMPFGSFQVADAQKLPFQDNYFSAVFCLEVLEHIDNPAAVLTGIRRVLKPGGYAVVLVPTDNLLFRVGWFIWNLYSPVWKHVHIQSFCGQRLEKMIRKAGLEIITVKTFNLGMLKIIIFQK